MNYVGKCNIEAGIVERVYLDSADFVLISLSEGGGCRPALAGLIELTFTELTSECHVAHFPWESSVL